MEYGFIAYLIVVSMILFSYMGIDKSRAKKQEWRISEKTLFTLAIFGGAIGGVLGMYVFRHKTLHNSFAFGFPILATIHVFIAVKVFT